MMLIICYSEVVPYKYIKSKSCKKNHPDHGLEYVQQAVFCTLLLSCVVISDNPIFSIKIYLKSSWRYDNTYRGHSQMTL